MSGEHRHEGLGRQIAALDVLLRALGVRLDALEEPIFTVLRGFDTSFSDDFSRGVA